MRKIIILNFVILGICCPIHSQQKKTNDQNSCKSQFTYGDKRFCLPIIEGMTECLSNQIVKDWSQKLNAPGTTDLAFYIKNDQYENIENLEDEIIDDYFKITAFTKLEGQNISRSHFNDLSSALEGNMIQKKLEDVLKKIEEMGVDFTIEQPLLLEVYTPDENVRSMVMFAKYIMDTGAYYMINVTSLIFTKQRLFILNYTSNYQDEKSINQAKIKSNHVVFRFVDVNK